MVDDPLLVVPPAPGGQSNRKITCEFCECSLGASGEYLKLSDKARKLRKLEDENTALEGTIAELRRQIEALKSAEPKTAPAGAKRAPLSF